MPLPDLSGGQALNPLVSKRWDNVSANSLAHIIESFAVNAVPLKVVIHRLRDRVGVAGGPVFACPSALVVAPPKSRSESLTKIQKMLTIGWCGVISEAEAGLCVFPSAMVIPDTPGARPREAPIAEGMACRDGMPMRAAIGKDREAHPGLRSEDVASGRGHQPAPCSRSRADVEERLQGWVAEQPADRTGPLPALAVRPRRVVLPEALGRSARKQQPLDEKAQRVRTKEAEGG
jgi:hypothetical protein